MDRIPTSPTLSRIAGPAYGRETGTAGDLNHAPRILVLYGALRKRSFIRFLTYEVMANGSD